MMTKGLLYLSFSIVLVLLLGCSENGFHLRKNVELPVIYKHIQIENIVDKNVFRNTLQQALEEAGGQVVDTANIKIKFSNFREGKRVVAYTSKRKARVYLLFLKFEYEVSSATSKSLEQHRINLDRTFLYDANFALGKAEEEDQIRHDLYTEAARLILLRLEYAER